MILIFYAFAREVRAFKRHLSGRSEIGISGLRGFRGRLASVEIVGVATGIGAGRAANAARRALDALPEPALVIATGVAGALSEPLKAGDLVLADRIIASAAEPAPAPPSAIAIPAADLDSFKSRLAAGAIKFTTGAILTVPLVLKDARAKRAAGIETGAIAVDMESAPIAAEAGRRGLRFACVRAILDAVDEEVIGSELAGPDGEVRPMAAAGFMLRNPAAALRLPRMLRGMNRAGAALAAALGALSAA